MIHGNKMNRRSSKNLKPRVANPDSFQRPHALPPLLIFYCSCFSSVLSADKIMEHLYKGLEVPAAKKTSWHFKCRTGLSGRFQTLKWNRRIQIRRLSEIVYNPHFWSWSLRPQKSGCSVAVSMHHVFINKEAVLKLRLEKKFLSYGVGFNPASHAGYLLAFCNNDK